MKGVLRASVLVGLASLLLAGKPGGGQLPAAIGNAVETDGSSRASGREPAPAFAEKDIHGKRTVALKDYLGKVVMLNFWGTWCGPCREEVPALKAIQARHKGQVVVIGVSVFSSEHDTRRFCKEYGIDYPVVYGSFDLMEKYDKVAVIPTTFLVDREGAIAAKVVGSRTREQYEEMLEPLLNP
ncbi:MAG TPA: TlpA disulfide reductase family protein [Anaeromyxobacter sp.]|nr:TlpA disulfide reductase family protein [Anaeromyxobacter sp.]